MLMVPKASAGPHEHAAGAKGAAGPRRTDALASASDVSLYFRGKLVLEHVSIAVHPSEIVTLIGPNGAGKTTLARMLLGLVKPSSGTAAGARLCALATCRSVSQPTGSFRLPCGALCR